jgi:hypothetical protein
MLRVLFCMLCLVLAQVAGAEDVHAADHQALQQLMTSVSTALNEQRYDDVAAHFDASCSLTFVDQGVVHDAAGLKTYFAKWFAPESPLASVHFAPRVGQAAVFFTNDSAFATGTSDDFYVLKDGRSATMPSTWTAVVTRRDGDWKLVTLHLGVNPMDNVVLDAARATGQRMAVIGGLVTAAVALVLGVLLGARLTRKPA